MVWRKGECVQYKKGFRGKKELKEEINTICRWLSLYDRDTVSFPFFLSLLSFFLSISTSLHPSLALTLSNSLIQSLVLSIHINLSISLTLSLSFSLSLHIYIFVIFFSLFLFINVFSSLYLSLSLSLPLFSYLSLHPLIPFSFLFTVSISAIYGI